MGKHKTIAPDTEYAQSILSKTLGELCEYVTIFGNISMVENGLDHVKSLESLAIEMHDRWHDEVSKECDERGLGIQDQFLVYMHAVMNSAFGVFQMLDRMEFEISLEEDAE